MLRISKLIKHLQMATWIWSMLIYQT